MKYITALIIKFIMLTAVLWIVLGIFGVSFADILLTSIVLTGVSFIGDVFILPRVGNMVATLADFGLAFVMIWLMGSVLFEQPVRLGIASLISAMVIAAGEFVFHMYLLKQVVGNEQAVPENRYSMHQQNIMQTEFGSEPDIKPPKKDKLSGQNHKQRPKKRKKKNPY
ncbi:YndM family protein [Filibacter tadaridae]|uniref:DUF2512 family protein n=1 Tax=Filibacter tadaridae TaxID=2483811 RepID=A0A3P5WRD8_9BACL|nr:YndM family protein [Filibacter tadaridae]VDC25963.1 hypothetical protein FILTAD_01385 [Filibacter tadaridae]